MGRATIFFHRRSVTTLIVWSLSTLLIDEYKAFLELVVELPYQPAWRRVFG